MANISITKIIASTILRIKFNATDDGKETFLKQWDEEIENL